MRAMWREFRDFVAGGNVVGLAVAVILGTAFGLVVTSFTSDILMQLIAAIGAAPSFSDLSFPIRGTEIRYGAFLDAVVNFLIIGVVMFFVIKAYNRVARPGGPAEKEIDVLKQIRDSLNRDRDRVT